MAEITVGNILPDEDTAFVEEGDAANIYIDYEINSRYEKDGHKYSLGITSPNGFDGASVAFVQLAAPTLLWIVDWTVCRLNTPPDIPDPNPSDANWVLLDDFWEPAKIAVMADGQTPVYRLTGTYIYGHKNPNIHTHKDVHFPRPPWLQDLFTRLVPDTSLKQNLALVTDGGVFVGPIPPP